jgi:hypothetical protein
MNNLFYNRIIIILTSVIIFLILFFFKNCKVQQIISESLYYRFLEKDKTTQYQNYTQLPSKWHKRVHPLESHHLNYAIKMNQIDGFTQVPVPLQSMENVQKNLEQIQNEMDPVLNGLLDQYLLGIYFCKNLGSSALSGYVFDEHDEPKGGFMIFDYDMIDKTANEWITFKENTVFHSKNIQLSIKIEEPKNNTVANSLRYLLIHEFGHILSVSKKHLPPLHHKIRNFLPSQIVKGIWKTETDSSYDTIYPIRKTLRFYQDPKINLDDNWKLAYIDLEKTPFPTLYSIVNIDEFYADSFVSYIHCMIHKRPWELILIKDNKVIHLMENGITKERSKVIRTFFEKEFGFNN